MPGMLHGKVAVVTGAGSGIGRETARVLVEHGARVVVTDLIKDLAEETAEQIDARDSVISFAADVADLAAVEQLMAEAVHRFGRLDIVHNNAGIDHYGPDIAEVPIGIWKRVIEVNLNGVFHGIRAAIPHMITHGGGSIVNTASALGQVALPHQAAYVASKFGVIGLTKAAALEYATRGIRVNAVLPGVIETPMVVAGTAEHPDLLTSFLSDHPIGRLGQPREVGQAVAWLGSDHSSFVTGTTLAVDGGYLAH